MSETNLLDIPWFAFDIPEHGTVHTKQLKASNSDTAFVGKKNSQNLDKFK